jgi:hypothetical protein
MTPPNVFNARIEPFQNGRRSELGESTRVRSRQRTGQLHNALPSSADVCVTCLVNGGITVPSRPVWSRISEVPPWSCCTCGQGSESLRIKCHRGQGLAVLERWECVVTCEACKQVSCSAECLAYLSRSRMVTGSCIFKCGQTTGVEYNNRPRAHLGH